MIAYINKMLVMNWKNRTKIIVCDCILKILNTHKEYETSSLMSMSSAFNPRLFLEVLMLVSFAIAAEKIGPDKNCESQVRRLPVV